MQSSEGDKENKSPVVKDINMKDIKSENENSQSVSDEDLNLLLRKFKSFITEKKNPPNSRSKLKKIKFYASMLSVWKVMPHKGKKSTKLIEI